MGILKKKVVHNLRKKNTYIYSYLILKLVYFRKKTTTYLVYKLVTKNI